MDASSLFTKLSNNSIEYAVMRNAENLPQVQQTDLDLYVRSDHKEKFTEALFELTRAGVFYVIKGTASRDFASFTVFDARSKTISGFRLDVNFGIFFRGQRLIEPAMISTAITSDAIPFFTEELLLLCYWLKCFINNENPRDEYIQRTKEIGDTDYLLAVLWPEFFCANAKFQFKFLNYVRANIQSDTSVAKTSLKVRLNLRQLAFASYEKVIRYFQPGGMWIAFAGVDGTGKSTFINAIKNDLQNPTHGKVSVSHFRPKLLPARSTGTESSHTTHEIKVSRSLSHLIFKQLKLSYLLIDYVLGYFFKIRVQLSSRGGAVIFDRYAMDLIYDPERINLSKLGPIWRVIWKMVPQPDVTFVIIADPQKVFDRKPERSLSDIKRLQKNLVLLASTNLRYHIVENNSDFADGYMSFSKAFFTYIEKKTFNDSR